MTVKRVFVLAQRGMFHKGIETLLSEKDGVVIVGQDTEPNTAIECIEMWKPDVILVNLDDPEPDLSSSILGILQKRLDVCIIGLSLQDNKICIYRGENKQVHQLEDLFSAILD